MCKEFNAPLPSVDDYLERIGLSGAQPIVNLEWLDRLVHAQLISVPFDDMDVWGRGDCPSLATEDLFDKIVCRRRGGYCFELNSLFCALLKSLGFDAYTVIVHILREPGSLPVPSHCAIVCVIDGMRFFCDVGFGGPVPDGAVAFGGAFRHGHRVVADGIYHVVEAAREDGAAEAIMVFKDAPAMTLELIPLNYYVSQKEDSLFRQIPLLNLRLPNGSVSVKGKHFCYRAGEERTEYDMENLSELKSVLVNYFGICPDEAPLRELAD